MSIVVFQLSGGLGRSPGFWVSRVFSHRFAAEGDAVMTLHQAVQDGVGNGLVADSTMPMLKGQLAGDAGSAAHRAVIDNFQQIVTHGRVQWGHAPIVK